MRDPKRIPEILEELKKAWEKNPDLRLGQIIVNIARIKEKKEETCPFVFYIEDNKILEGLKYMNRIK